ncbi:MAG: LuxR C-terminal-related transcriptional regulator [Rubricella sp.]
MESLDRIGFEHAPIGLVAGRNRTIARANLAFHAMFGFAPGTLEGESLSRLYPSTEEFERIGALGLAEMRRTGAYADERIMRRASGDLFWCRVEGRSLTPEDPFALAIWSFRDIIGMETLGRLTAREREVAMLLARGLTAKEIARTLDLSPRTAEAHRASLLAKLDARNVPELVARLSGIPL